MMDVRREFPLPDTDWEPIREFWAGAAANELRIPRCDSCGRLCWYPRDTCRQCKGEGFTWEALSGRGTLFSWVVVTHPFLPQFADLTPFAPALVALEEDPTIRLATRIVDADLETLEFEMLVTVAYRPLRFTGVEGEVTAPLFVPA